MPDRLSQSGFHVGEKAVLGYMSISQGKFALWRGNFALYRGNFAFLRGNFALFRGNFAFLRGNFAFLRGNFAFLRGKSTFLEANPNNSVKLMPNRLSQSGFHVGEKAVLGYMSISQGNFTL